MKAESIILPSGESICGIKRVDEEPVDWLGTGEEK